MPFVGKSTYNNTNGTTNTTRKKGFYGPSAYENQVYEIKLEDGTTLSNISYGAKKAIETNTLDSYTPKNDSEKKSLEALKKMYYSDVSDEDSRKKANLDDLQKEIDNLETIQNKANEYKHSIQTLTNRANAIKHRTTGLSTGSTYEQQIKEKEAEYKQFLIDSGFQNIEDIEKQLSEKKQYKNSAKYIQDGIALADNIRAESNFSEYVAKGESLGNEKADGWFVPDTKRKNVVAYLRNNPEAMKAYEDTLEGTNGTVKRVLTEGNENYKLAKYGTEEQVENYYAYLGKGDTENAEKYLKSIEESLNIAMGNEIAKDKDNTFKKLTFGVTAGTDQFEQGMTNLVKTLGKDEYIPTSPTQIASGQVRESLKDSGFKILGTSVGQGAYDLITTTSNMLPSIGASYLSNAIVPGSGAYVGATLMGGSAAGNSYQEKLNAGWDKKQALTYAAIVGTSEAGLQYALGGIGSLGGKISGKSAQAIARGIDNAALRFATTYGMKMGSEGLEEALQEVLNPFFENIALGYQKNNLSDIEWEQVAYSGVLGALSAGFIDGVGTSADVFGENKNANQMGKYLKKSDYTSRMLEIAASSPKESATYDLYTRYANKGINAENISELQLGRLFVNAESDVQNTLSKKKIAPEQEQSALTTLNELNSMKPEASISIGDKFTDTKTGNTFTVTNRVDGKTIVEVETSKGTITREFSDNRIGSFIANGQIEKIESGNANTVTTEDTATAEEISATVSKNETVENELVEEDEVTASVRNAITSGNLTSNQVNDIISNPSSRDAFAKLTGVEIKGTNAEQRAIVRNWANDSSNVENLNRKNTGSDVSTVVDSIKETLEDGAKEVIFESMQKSSLPQDITIFAKSLIGIYKKTGTLGYMADYFTDNGAKVVSSIESTLSKSNLDNSLDNETVVETKQNSAKALQNEPASVTMEEKTNTKTVPDTDKSHTVAYTNDNERIELKFKVVSVDDLIVSNSLDGKVNPNYPQELQPRDRSRTSSQSQIRQMAANINPARLEESTSVSDGSPIVGPDNVVESGNGRTLAIELAYKNGTADEYRNHIINNADKYGIDASNLPERPVLVRERLTEVDRIEFTRKANESAIGSLSATEQAKVDAEKLTVDVLNLLVANDDGIINTSDNHNFISAVITKVFKNEDLNNVVGADGRLSARGLERITNAIFYKAYGDASLSARLSESLDNDMKNATKVLLNIAPRVVSIKNDIASGVLYDFDFSTDIVSAIKLFEKCRNENTTVNNYASQTTMFEKEPQLTLAMAYVFETKNRGAKQATDFYNLLLDTVTELGNPNQISLDIVETFQTKEEVFDATVEKFNNGVESKNTIAIPENIYGPESEQERENDRRGIDEVSGNEPNENEKTENAVGVQPDNGRIEETGVVANDEQLRQKNESLERESKVKGENSNEQTRSYSLSENSRWGHNGGARKQTERISYFKRKNQGRNAKERQSFARELIERGQAEEITKKIGKHTYKYNLVKSEAYNDDMLAMVEEAKKKGVELGFFIGNAKVNFDSKNAFLINGIKISESQILVQYNEDLSPQKIFKHELIHAKWKTRTIQAIKNTILSNLSETDKNSILSQERMQRYQTIYKDNEGKPLMDIVWEEFVCDVMSGMSDYTTNHIDTVYDYWYGNEEVDSYSPADYTTSTDAGGRYNLSDVSGYPEWVRDVLDDFEFGKLESALLDIESGANANYYNRSASGEYIIQTDNKLIYTYGKHSNPQISKVIEFNSKYETEIDEMRRRIYEVEKGKSEFKMACRIIERAFGQGSVIEHTGHSNATNGKSTGLRKGTGGKGNSVNSSKKQRRNRYVEEIRGASKQGLKAIQKASRKLKKSGVRYSISPEENNAYMTAVESGDMETAQRIVDDVAKANGYNIKAYHGTPNKDFTVFDKNRVGKGTDQYGAGFYFASNKDAARSYGARVIDSLVSLNNPIKIDGSSEEGANLIDGGYNYLLTEEQAYEVIKRLPNIYDSEESPLGDYFDSYWESGAEDWMIEELAANEFNRNIGYLDSDLFRNYPNELHDALREVIGYDGVEVTFANGDKFYVAWFDNQMKSSDAVTYDDGGNVIPLSERFNENNKDIRYSIAVDSENNTLTETQQENFKDSKVRDDNGNLLVMYQGSANDFTVFDRKKSSYANLYGRGFYFTKNENHASRYGNTRAYYLNIKHPVSTTETTITKAQLRKFLQAVAENEDYSFENYGYDATVDSVLQSTYGKSDFLMLNDVSQTAIGDLVETVELFNEVNGTDYDGIILDTETVTFNSEQAKLTSNKKPTSNPDIRYSLADNSYAPTFYSHMSNVIDGMKQDKIGVKDVIRYLTDPKRGVKTEEIKWTGIEEFLEGKKSVTKAELQEFIANNQLQIEEITLDNNEIPYTQEQNEKIKEYESERNEVFEKLKSEWKKAIGSDFPMQTFGLGLESSVVNLLMETDRQIKESVDSGKEMVEAREQLKKIFEEEDFGYDSKKEAYMYAVRNPYDFMYGYELTDEQKAIFERFISAKEDYKNSEGIPIATQRHIKDIAAEADAISRKISRVKSEHYRENAKHMSKWGEYTLDGGENYREIIFKMPDSTYSNAAMTGHWSGSVVDGNGVLAHARIQDFDVDGKRMLFIEEIQSDWHNEGAKRGYVKSNDADIRTKRQELENYIKSRLGKENSAEEIEKLQEARREYIRLGQDMSNADAVPDAPFRNNYHEYVLKRLIRMAAEEGYDSIGWTTAGIQSDRWSNEYAEGYRIEYDQDIPKFLNKYGKKWGAKVGKTPLSGTGSYTDYFEFEGAPTEYYTVADAEQGIVDRYNKINPEQQVSKVDTMFIAGQFVVYDRVTGIELGRFDRVNAPTKVWSMDITDSMRDSVLYEGQARYSLATDGVPDLEDLWEYAIKEYGTIPKGEKPARDIDVPKKINEKDVVSLGARTMLEAGVTPDWAVSEFEKRILDGTMTHEVITNKKAGDKAKQTIEHLGFEEALNRWSVLSDAGKVGKKELALGMELYNQCITNKDVHNAMKVASELVAEATRAGQTLQAVRMLKLMTPDGQLYYLEKSIQKMNEEFKQKFGDKYKDIELDDDLMEEFLTEKDEEKRNEIYDRVCQHIADQIPSTKLDKWNAWRYLAMLGNPRTHIRNFVGNAVFIPSVRLKTYIGAVIEKTAKVDVSERTKSLRKSKVAVEFAKKDVSDKDVQKMLQGENAKYAVTNDIESKRTIFDKGWQKWIEKLRLKNFDFLEKEDMWFLKMHYSDALARLITARNIDINSITPQMLETLRAYAIKEAQAATYRDANALADGLNILQRKIERSDNKAIRATSVLVEGVMPFKKTPLNIAKQGINYSPIGILKGIYNSFTKLKKGDATVTDVIDDLSKGLSGTMVMMLGYLLASMGLLVGDEDKSKKEKEFDKMVGEQSYAVKLFGNSYTIDWMTPSNLSLFIGSKLHDLTKDEFEVADVLGALSTVSEPLLELSVFSGVNGVIESAQYSDSEALLAIGSDMITSYLMQALPTITGQMSRIVDGSKREYYYADKNSAVPQGLQRLIGQASSKIPFASYLFQPAIDEWGREETYGNIVERAFENTVSPGYYSKDNYTRVDKELRKLHDKTGDTSVLPVIQQKYYTEDYVKYDMSAEDYTKVKRLRGKKSFELIRDLIYSEDYLSMTDDEKVRAIQKCYQEAGDYAKEQMLEKVKSKSKR